MRHTVRVERAARAEEFDAFLLSLGQKEPLAPDAECWVARQGADIVAALATYRRDDLHAAPGVSGLIGHYGARDPDAGVVLLRAAASALDAEGAARVLGPMNGSTWARYRFALSPETPEEANEPPYLSEPVNPAAHLDQFTAAGFTPIVEYESRIQRDLAVADPKAESAAVKVAAAGIGIEPLSLERFEETLAEIHALSLESFGDNPYYRPIARDAFLAMYTPLRPILDPALVELARDGAGALVGFAFAFVDPLGAAAGAPGRVVLKTLVTKPTLRGVGLGSLLMDRTRSIALDKGHRAVIHALMHLSNASKRMSERSTTRFRRYALFEWTSP
jgi:GNAT superfamily N-acetyltransferase